MKHLIIFVTLLISFSTQAERMDVLFLGHSSKHHDAQQYAMNLSQYLFEDNIYLTFEYTPDILSLEYLEKFDALILYANHESIEPNENTALLNFVRNGGAFLPLHCASACFVNSKEYINMVGGQFKSHGYDSFKTDFVKPNHPILEGIEPFYTKDETYVHENLNPDKEILILRENEPWTWVRNEGEGKVFYTAYGHDENTWNHPSFKKMIRNALVWATGITPSREVKKDYKDAKLPNYRKVNPPPLYQLPLTPEKSMQLTATPPGYKLELFASEPDIINPIALNWDEKGRLWAIETVDYPNTVRSEGGLDKIKILEDTDGDGRCDKVTVFADSLNIPTSLAFVNGGVLVSAAPSFYFLKDTDGDDRADIKREILKGWGTYDTHAGPSNLKYGFDNTIWGAVGYSAFENGDNKFSMGLYRFDKGLTKPEFISKFDNNTWGLGFNEEFEVFGSTANNTHSLYISLPNRFFEGVKGINAFGNKKIDGHYEVRPLTDKYLQVDVFGGFTAASGHNFYTGSQFPVPDGQQIAFICEPTVHLVHVAKIFSEGSSYIERDGWNIISSADEWFSPVYAETGPDGALWIADWYNFIVQHNPTPEGFDNGKGNAYLQPLRDKNHGRIYRVEYAGKDHGVDYPDLSKNSGIISALSGDNYFWRLKAQQKIVEEKKEELVPQLYELLNSNNPKAALHAMASLSGLEKLLEYPDKEKLFTNVNPAVRRNALLFLSEDESIIINIQKHNLLKDSDLKVRLAACQALKGKDLPEGLLNIIIRESRDIEVIKDEFLSQAYYVLLADNSALTFDIIAKNYPELLSREIEMTNYEASDYDDGKWNSYEVPKQWADEIKDFRGTIWFRTQFHVEDPDGEYILSLGPIDENDITYVNGIEVGKMLDFKWQEPRNYKIPKGTLQKGRNTIAVKVENQWGTGGIYGEPDQLYALGKNKKIPLSGVWKYKIVQNIVPKGSLFADEDILSVFLKNYSDVKKKTSKNKVQKQDKAREITIRAVRFKLQFDIKEFSVKPGEKIRLKLINDDVMRHNLLISTPGSLTVVGKAADQLATNPEGSKKHWVPEIKEVLFSTELVDAAGEFIIEFTVPEEKGDYPFICTFPGHWRTMNGIMKVE